MDKSIIQKAKVKASPRLVEVLELIERKINHWEICDEERLLKDIHYLENLTDHINDELNEQLLGLAMDIHYKRFESEVE